MSTRFLTEEEITWDINEGKISMYWDTWMAMGKLGDRVQTAQDHKVSDFFQGEGWNEQKIRNEFQENTSNEIIATPIYSLTNNPDRMIWKAFLSGVFSLASCYEIFREHRHKTFVKKSICLKPTPIKVSFFMSNLFRFKLPTDLILYKFGINGPSRCQCCIHPQEETLQHLFASGDLAMEVWKQFEMPIGI